MAKKKSTTYTRKYKSINRVMKQERFPIPDVEGHLVGVQVREGVIVYEDGELAWQKVIGIHDLVNGLGSALRYVTTTFQDGSTITTYYKNNISSGSYPIPGEIIHGTGRFKGIKGTATGTAKILTPEPGETSGKAVSEGTTTYTLPSK